MRFWRKALRLFLEWRFCSTSFSIMWIKHFAVSFAAFFALLLSMPGLSQASHAQEVFVAGGAVFSDAPAVSSLDGTRPVGQVGVRLPYTDLFTLQGALAYQDLVALEGTIQFHPFERVSGVNFYGFGGFGYVVAGEGRERSVVPLGVGAEVPLGSGLSLNVETGGRWTIATNEPARSLDLGSGIAPGIGITYNFDEAERGADDAPAPTPPTAEAQPENARVPEASGENDADGGTTARKEAEQRSASERPSRVAETAPLPDDAQQRTDGAAQRRSAARPDTTDDESPSDELRKVPAGTFVMGLTDEDPLDLQQAGRKRISVTSFKIEKFEVSNADYRAFLKELPPDRREAMRPDSSIWEQARSRSNWETYFRGERFAKYPVIGVTHEQAERYCQFYDKRLPTEAEWEYAARGDLVGSIYPWRGYEPRNNRGNYLANYNPDRGGYAADGYAFTAPGDAYPPSSWGLYHMSGNVAEWVKDNYHPSYSDLSDFNPLFEDPDEDRYIVRGGSWASNAFYIGVGVRESQPGDKASPYIGFRCASNVDSEN
jgi:formylglycine-generating enzyme required for sulfatase activity